MLNVIWGFFLIGGILTGAFLGRMDLVTNAVIDGGRNAVELAFTMAGVVAVWSGILKIAEKGGMIDALAEKMEPFLDFLFPEVPRGHAARRYISANFAANFLGLGWAATPAGLLAMEELAKLNGKTGRASNAMCMFLVVNMSSLQLVTVNILAYRAEYGSAAPAEIMGAGIAATLGTTLVGILLAVFAVVPYGAGYLGDILNISDRFSLGSAGSIVFFILLILSVFKFSIWNKDKKAVQ